MKKKMIFVILFAVLVILTITTAGCVNLSGVSTSENPKTVSVGEPVESKSLDGVHDFEYVITDFQRGDSVKKEVVSHGYNRVSTSASGSIFVHMNPEMNASIDNREYIKFKVKVTNKGAPAECKYYYNDNLNQWGGTGSWGIKVGEYDDEFFSPSFFGHKNIDGGCDEYLYNGDSVEFWIYGVIRKGLSGDITLKHQYNTYQTLLYKEKGPSFYVKTTNTSDSNDGNDITDTVKNTIDEFADWAKGLFE